jgi:hypothetical protein
MEIAKQKIMSENVLSTRCIYGSEIVTSCPVRSGFSAAELYPETLVYYCENCPFLMGFKIIMAESSMPKPKRKVKTKQ